MMHSRHILMMLAVDDDDLTKDANKTDKRKKNSLNGPVKLLNYTILCFHLQKLNKTIKDGDISP